ncbi:hypothetical protein VTN96DRAFT_9041 [Rasamsonia emersonii]
MKNHITPALAQDLRSQLDASTKLVTPSSPDYGTAIMRWSDTAVRPAGAVAFPQTGNLHPNTSSILL